MQVGPYTLRPPQVRAVEQTRAAMAECLRTGKRPRVIMQAVCGFGKTICSSFIMQEAKAKGKRSAFIVHGRQLVFQKSDKLCDADMFHTVVMADVKGELRAAALPYKGELEQCSVISKDTYGSMLDQGIDPFEIDLWIIDECDLATSDSWWNILQKTNVPMIGLTGTPSRSNGIGLGDRWDGLVVSAPHQELIDHGFIVPCGKVYSPWGVDTRDVEVNGDSGEYVQDQIAARCFTGPLVGNFVEEWWKLANMRPTVFFASSVDHSIAQAKAFREGDGTLFARPLAWEHIDADTPQPERKRMYRALGEGDLNGISNYAVFRRGVDCTAVSCIQFGIAMASTREYLQSVGRAQRTHPGKSDFIVIDHGHNVTRHLWPQLDRDWRLDNRKPLNLIPGKGSPEGVKTCSKCGTTYKRSLKLCPTCGFQKVRHGEMVRTIDGALVEMDRPEVKEPKPSRAISDEQRAFERVYFAASRSHSRRPCNFKQLQWLFNKRYPHLRIVFGERTMVLNKTTGERKPLGYVPEPYSPLWDLPVRDVPREKLQQPAYGEN